MASPKAPILDGAGKKSKDATLEEAVFGAEVKPHLVHEAVRAEQNAQRGGTRAVKSRGLVAGGRGKPWRQKGTGRARAGTTRAPQWTGGGVAFAPRTNFTVKVNRKARKAAFRAALSEPRLRTARLRCSTAPAFTEPSTKQAAALLAAWGKELPVLLVVREDDEQRHQVVPEPGARAGDHAGRARGRRHRLGPGAPRHRGRARGRPEARCRVSLHPNEVLLAPVVSEKSYSLIEDRKYSFRVHQDAHKTQVRQAVEELFGVKVQRVNIIQVRSKPKRRGMIRGRRPGWKKAIVQLREGETIEIFEGAQV